MKTVTVTCEVSKCYKCPHGVRTYFGPGCTGHDEWEVRCKLAKKKDGVCRYCPCNDPVPEWCPFTLVKDSVLYKRMDGVRAYKQPQEHVGLEVLREELREGANAEHVEEILDVVAEGVRRAAEAVAGVERLTRPGTPRAVTWEEAELYETVARVLPKLREALGQGESEVSNCRYCPNVTGGLRVFEGAGRERKVVVLCKAASKEGRVLAKGEPEVDKELISVPEWCPLRARPQESGEWEAAWGRIESGRRETAEEHRDAITERIERRDREATAEIGGRLREWAKTAEVGAEFCVGSGYFAPVGMAIDEVFDMKEVLVEEVRDVKRKLGVPKVLGLEEMVFVVRCDEEEAQIVERVQ